MIKASITFDQDIQEIYKCIDLDLTKEFKRSKLEVNLNKDNLNFEIEANDFTALKATLNSIIQMVDVFYKLKNNIKKNE